MAFDFFQVANAATNHALLFSFKIIEDDQASRGDEFGLLNDEPDSSKKIKEWKKKQRQEKEARKNAEIIFTKNLFLNEKNLLFVKCMILKHRDMGAFYIATVKESKGDEFGLLNERPDSSRKIKEWKKEQRQEKEARQKDQVVTKKNLLFLNEKKILFV